VSAPASAAPFLARLARRRRFRAEDARGWSGARARLPWPEAREALELLLSRGIIRREPTRRPR
jgi:hypothetical protein